MEVKDVRRRLVQSTLFPRVESSIKGGENCGGNGGDEVREEEQEECGCSQTKSGSKRKGNSKPKKTPRASPKKVIENDEETSIKQVFDDSGSPVITKSSFFVKVSARRQQKKQQEQLVLIESPEGNETICSPPRSRAKSRSTPRKLKREDNSTPNKERRNSTPNKKIKSGKKELCCKQIPFDLVMDEQQLLTIPDLRLEAKLSAEENSRVFAGRQIHPFFTSRKGGKSSLDLTNSESKWCSFEKKEKGTAFNLIHVFEDVEGDPMALNWGDWVFSERSATDDLDCGCSPVYEGSVDSLNFDNFLNASNFTRTSLYRNSGPCTVSRKKVFGLPDNTELSHLLSPLLITDKREICIDQQKDSDVIQVLQDHKHEKSDFCDEIPSGGSSKSEFQDRLLEERIMSHYHTSQIQTKNCLWTDKYQPQNANQICGNGESVNFLTEWLRLWHERGSLTSRNCINGNYSTVQDIDHDYQQSDSDTDSNEESMKSVLLVTGPVGSGKSAAIYACARDQGFQIIEINASDWRNGALVKQKFGEAVESHWLQRTVENATKSDNKSLSKFFNTVNEETHCSDDEVIEVEPFSDKDSQDAGSWPKMPVSGSNRSANRHSEIKTLILFEDVDATIHEDHGFIATIQQLAETAKRPMILTSNSDNPVLPKNLDRLEINFAFPSVEELIRLISMICAAEKANIRPCLIERFVNYCQGDIRKTIMLLQFWCQGRTPRIGHKLYSTYWPVLFDLEAGHHTLPSLIPWGYPSQLSELVAEEIETHDLNDYTTENNIYAPASERDSIKAKKEAMLSQCTPDEVECLLFDANCDLFDFPDSPIAFTRQRSRRKMILSSDSEDEFLSDPLVSTEIPHPPHEHLERFGCSQTEDTCESRDVSRVPESSFVPETVIFNETELFSATVSYGHFIDETGDIRIFQDEDSLPIEEEMLENDCYISTACVDREEVGDSLSKSEAGALGGYQPLDECSRVDFMRTSKPLENYRADPDIDFVKETWRKLHEQSRDLNKYVTAEERTARRGLIFAHGMSNLISEADLLFKDCRSIASDSLESSTIPSEKIHSYTYYENQLEMSSILGQHGMCLYAKEIASLGSVVGSANISGLASEMLSSSTSSVALGKLASQDQRRVDRTDNETTTHPNYLTSKSDSSLSEMVRTIVPSKLYLTPKVAAFHEYVSTLSQISRYEASRLSECTRRKQRRARAPRHYLSSGSLALSSEDISLLGQYNNYINVPFSS